MPAELSDIVMRCLSKTPAARYQRGIRSRRRAARVPAQPSDAPEPAVRARRDGALASVHADGMKLVHDIAVVHTTHPFAIARGGDERASPAFAFAIVDDDGVEGWGEAAPNRFYGETAEPRSAALARLAPIVEACDRWAIEDVEAEMNRALRATDRSSPRSAPRCTISPANGSAFRSTVCGDSIPPRRRSRASRSRSPPNDDELRDVAWQAPPYPMLKVKLGTDHDARDHSHRSRGRRPKRRCASTPTRRGRRKQALRMIDVLAACGVEYVEQPVAAHDLDGLRFVRERSALPVIADESCVVATDIPRLAGVVDGINIKLSKCGGLREALDMIATARAHGMLVMAGCMIETSLGITAAAHLAPLLDYADLDGAALLADDPYVGATITAGVIGLPTGSGLGVSNETEGRHSPAISYQQG